MFYVAHTQSLQLVEFMTCMIFQVFLCVGSETMLFLHLIVSQFVFQVTADFNSKNSEKDLLLAAKL